MGYTETPRDIYRSRTYYNECSHDTHKAYMIYRRHTVIEEAHILLNTKEALPKASRTVSGHHGVSQIDTQ